MYNIAILGDSHDSLKVFLEMFDRKHSLQYKIFKFNSLTSFKKNPPLKLDFLFIDINLNYKKIVLDVFNDIKNLYGVNTKVIFIVDIIDFMVNGFVLKDFSYILKPFKYIDFELEFLPLVEPIPIPHISKYLIDNISVSSILYIQKNLNGATINTNNKSLQVPYDINIIESTIDLKDFYRCHEDYIINLSYLSKISKSSVSINSSIIPVDKDKFYDLKNKLLFKLNII